jgi:hypothetical protein
MADSNLDQMLNKSIAAYKANDMTTASKFLAQVIKQDPNSERAWLWLSGIVTTDAERLFCIKRLLVINPENEIAKHGLTLLPSDLKPVQPSLEKVKRGNVEICTFPGCDQPVSQLGFKFCYKHWKAVNTPIGPKATLTATTIGEKLNLNSRRTNLLFSELGWITRDKGGWILTPQGKALGAVDKTHPQTGKPFVQWPDSILSNKALQSTIQNLLGETDGITVKNGKAGNNNFREKFTPTHRATDGHWVRSKAEMLIDNWLYMSGIAHAYERQLPVEEDLFCDFYIPEGKVYIEYWGMEKDPKYSARKKEKIEIYKKYSFNLIELNDDHVKNLDDYLPKILLKHNIVIS